MSQRVHADHMVETEWLTQWRFQMWGGLLCAQVQQQPHRGEDGISVCIFDSTPLRIHFVESLLVFVSVVGLSPAVFPFHLHGSDNNTCTGHKELRTRDPRLKRKKNSHHVWVTHCGTFSAKARNKIKIPARITRISKRGVSPDCSSVAWSHLWFQTYLCYSFIA